MVAVYKAAVRTVQGFANASADGGQNVKAVFVQVAITTRRGQTVNRAAACFGHVREGVQREALEICFGDEVHNTANGIGSVNGRRAVFQDFDALKRSHRNLVHIDR